VFAVLLAFVKNVKTYSNATSHKYANHQEYVKLKIATSTMIVELESAVITSAPSAYQ
jgi:hypothetical protein